MSISQTRIFGLHSLDDLGHDWRLNPSFVGPPDVLEVLHKPGDAEFLCAIGGDAKSKEGLNVAVEERLSFVMDGYKLRGEGCRHYVATLPSRNFIEA